MTKAPTPKVVFLVNCVGNGEYEDISLEGIFDTKEKAERYKEERETDPKNAKGLKHKYFYFEVKEVKVK